MLRPWELHIEIKRNASTAIHAQISNKIISDIQNGRLLTGTALPGSRELAHKLNINRKTVIQAYESLIAQGWLTSQHKRGTFVSASAESQQTSQFRTISINKKPTLNSTYQRSIISFNDGVADVRLTPTELLSRATRHALNTLSRNPQLSHHDAKGARILREAIAQMLNLERDMHTKVDNICVSNSSHNALFIVSRALIKSGDIVITEKLTDQQACAAFINCGAQILQVNHDEQGIDIDHVNSLCLQYKIKAIFACPLHQIPTTATMSNDRRQRLVALAEQYQFTIIEDDRYQDLQYNKQRILPIASTPYAKNIVYLGSLSEGLSPHIKLGYIVSHPSLIQQIANQNALVNGPSDLITEHAIAELMRAGDIKKHILRTAKIYEERLNLTIQLASQELEEFVTFKPSNHGLGLWLKIRHHIKLNKLSADLATNDINLHFANQYSLNNENISAFRFGFAHYNREELNVAILRLKAIFRNQRSYPIYA